MRPLLVILLLQSAAGCGEDPPHLADSATADAAAMDSATADSEFMDSTTADSAAMDSTIAADCLARGASLCAAGMTPADVICDGDDPVMARCETFDPNEWWNPCDAPVGCSATAHVCGAAEYLGNVRAPVGQPAWIDACLRDGGDLFAVPREGRCSSCNDEVASEVVAAWQCDSDIRTSSATDRLGMRADRQCWEVGTNHVGGLWVPFGVTSRLKSVMCCN